MAVIDYKNIDHDILIDNGDFVKADCAQDHIEDILLANKGDYRQFPLVGVGLIKYINAPYTHQTKLSLSKQIRVQLEADQYKVRSVDATDLDNVQIDWKK